MDKPPDEAVTDLDQLWQELMRRPRSARSGSRCLTGFHQGRSVGTWLVLPESLTGALGIEDGSRQKNSFHVEEGTVLYDAHPAAEARVLLQVLASRRSLGQDASGSPRDPGLAHLAVYGLRPFTHLAEVATTQDELVRLILRGPRAVDPASPLAALPADDSPAG